MLTWTMVERFVGHSEQRVIVSQIDLNPRNTPDSRKATAVRSGMPNAPADRPAKAGERSGL
jgi:hypothetical protein